MVVIFSLSFPKDWLYLHMGAEGIEDTFTAVEESVAVPAVLIIQRESKYTPRLVSGDNRCGSGVPIRLG